MSYFTAAAVVKKKAKKLKNKIADSLNWIIKSRFKINSISFLVNEIINTVNGCVSVQVSIRGCGPLGLGSIPRRGLPSFFLLKKEKTLGSPKKKT